MHPQLLSLMFFFCRNALSLKLFPYILNFVWILYFKLKVFPFSLSWYSPHRAEIASQLGFTRSHTHTHPVGLPWTRHKPSHRPLLLQHTTSTRHNIHVVSRIRTCGICNQVAANLRLRPHGQRTGQSCTHSCDVIRLWRQCLWELTLFWLWHRAVWYVDSVS
jgi:hypothetical protein